MDRLTSEQRSRLMSRVRGKDTLPELAVRRLVHGLGYRFRLHRKDLPGRPDLTLPSQRKIIFVHGCFWHGHGCRWGKLPKSKLDYWGPKIAANRVRDSRNVRKLRRLGWQTMTVWQCQLRNAEGVLNKITRFLNRE